MLNTYAAFGYFSPLNDKAVRIRLVFPENWKIATSLPVDSAGYLYANSYYEMQDNPVIAGNLSQSVFKQGNKQFFIFTHSDDSRISSRNLKNLLKKSVRDADNFLGGSIPSNYCFLFNFYADTLNSGGGAHEHAKSSLYSFSTKKFTETKANLKWIVRHELFHTLIPLYLRTDEISVSDFMNRQPVSHLWFYEGLAQWAAFKMQVIRGSISANEYLKVLRNIILISDTKEDTLDFIRLSRDVIGKNSSLGDIYRRGFVFCALLDMYIIEKTDGKMTLRELLLKMREIYPSGKPFDSDSLFSTISGLTHPNVGIFLTNTLVKNAPVDISELFGHFDITYTERKKHPYVVSELGILLRSGSNYNCMVISGSYKEQKNTGIEMVILYWL